MLFLHVEPCCESSQVETDRARPCIDSWQSFIQLGPDPTLKTVTKLNDISGLRNIYLDQCFKNQIRRLQISNPEIICRPLFYTKHLPGVTKFFKMKILTLYHYYLKLFWNWMQIERVFLKLNNFKFWKKWGPPFKMKTLQIESHFPGMVHKSIFCKKLFGKCINHCYHVPSVHVYFEVVGLV